MRNDYPTHHHHDPAEHGRGGFRGARSSRAGHEGFGGFVPGAPGFGGFGPRGFMPPGPQRKRRGDVRIAILSLLSEKPSNGYGLIKEITDRSGGTWYPSPGSVYPTLQQLVDEDLIEATGEGKRTDFQLTASGTEWVQSHTDELEKIWQGADARIQADAGLHESIAKLMGVIHQLRFAATDAQRTKAIETLDETRRALYAILAD
ncbi:MAG: PadR family transcriptional regulator [Marmoricola sp.]|jgi:DNA-binding PadR family transcriptional regulator|nr:PadR family transcriptional regulator [Marmoricola sp.]